MRARLARPLAGVLLIGVVASGCTEEQRKQLSPTCAIAQKAADEAQRRAEDAIATITSDPAASRQVLVAVRTALQAAEATVSDDERAQLERAEQATTDLISQARRSERGRQVEGAVVTEARTALLDAVKGVRANC